ARAAAAAATAAAAGAGVGAEPLVHAASEGDLVRLRAQGAGSGRRCDDLSLPRGVYGKLVELARRRGGRTVSAAGTDGAIFLVLLRYQSLGGDGFQLALPAEGFLALKRLFGVRFECFASPLNCFWERFCSAFPDTDGPFGSVGSFLDFWPRSGSFEANPPFAPGIMAAAVDHVERLVGAKDAGPLSFAFIVPAWEQSAAWEALLRSPFRTAEPLRVPRERHVWRDPALRHRRAPVDTAVVFLQNAAGARRWPASRARLRQLRAACCGEAAPLPPRKRPAEGGDAPAQRRLARRAAAPRGLAPRAGAEEEAPLPVGPKPSASLGRVPSRTIEEHRLASWSILEHRTAPPPAVTAQTAAGAPP
ncbi:unnamed protein product, partial [Prorocentrum cordatum]